MSYLKTLLTANISSGFSRGRVWRSSPGKPLDAAVRELVTPFQFQVTTQMRIDRRTGEPWLTVALTASHDQHDFQGIRRYTPRNRTLFDGPCLPADYSPLSITYRPPA